MPVPAVEVPGAASAIKSAKAARRFTAAIASDWTATMKPCAATVGERVVTAAMSPLNAIWMSMRDSARTAGRNSRNQSNRLRSRSRWHRWSPLLVLPVSHSNPFSLEQGVQL